MYVFFSVFSRFSFFSINYSEIRKNFSEVHK